MSSVVCLAPQSAHIPAPEEFLSGLAEDFAALRADPLAWAEELAEREAWGVIFPRKIDEH